MKTKAAHRIKLSDRQIFVYCNLGSHCCITDTVRMQTMMPFVSHHSLASIGKQARLSMCLAMIFATASTAIARAATPISHLLAPSELRCGGVKEPLAIADAQPQLSWQLNASSHALHGVNEIAYRIQVTDANSGFAHEDSILWDSGVVHDSSSFGIAYAGPPLNAGHAYWWRVRVWDEHNHPSGWSEIAHWAQAPVWHAVWITAHGSEGEIKGEALPLFRKSFLLATPVTRAVLYASGLGQDELRLNGHKVGTDLLTPGWSDYRKTVFFDAYDVTHVLRKGQNTLGVLLGNGMYRVEHTRGRYTKFVASDGPPKCIVQLHIEFADGKTAEIDSDGTWKTMPGPITFSSTYGGEDFDARREPIGWDSFGFNDTEWLAATVADGPGGTLQPELSPPIRLMHSYLPIKRTHPNPGVLVYDLGQNFAGWPEIKIKGTVGSVIKLTPGELLDKHGMVSQRSSGGPQWFSYTIGSTGTEIWNPRFSYYGLRYLQVQGAVTGTVPPHGQARILSVRGQEVHSSSDQIGSFASSDALLNRIHALILRSIENNAESIFTDCPHREKLGWLEETHLMAPSMLYDFDFSGLYAATARNIADAQKTEGERLGMLPEIAPQYVVFDPKNEIFNDSPEWGSAAVLAPWYLYQRNGDLPFLAAQLPVMRRYVAYLATRAHDGILSYGLGDWYDIGPGSPGLSKLTTAGVTETAIYYQDLRVLEETTNLLRMSTESRFYREQAESVRDAFNTRFFDPIHHRYDTGSQTAQAMPLAIGIVSDDQRSAIVDALIAGIRAHQNHVTAGDIGFHYVVDALMDTDRSDVLLDMFERTDTPSYGYQLALGATSLTEAWDANPTNSQDHFMLGDAEEWFYRGLGGIDVDLSKHGTERLVLHPAVLPQIGWVRTHYRSSLGLVESNWQHDAAVTVYDFTIPANTIATVILTTIAPNSVTANGMQPSKEHGVISMSTDGSKVQLQLASGHYRIRAANSVATNR